MGSRLQKNAMGARQLRVLNPRIRDVVGLRLDVLVGLARKYSLKKLCEVGVKFGGMTRRLAEALPDAQIIGVDPWVVYADWPSWDQAKHNEHEKSFDKLVALFPGRIIKMKMTSVEAASRFADGALDLVFIDADHSYPAVRADIDAWLPKVRAGGILSGHDYNNTDKYGDYFKGVDKAVDESFPHANIAPGHVWWIRIP